MFHLCLVMQRITQLWMSVSLTPSKVRMHETLLGHRADNVTPSIKERQYSMQSIKLQFWAKHMMGDRARKSWRETVQTIIKRLSHVRRCTWWNQLVSLATSIWVIHTFHIFTPEVAVKMDQLHQQGVREGSVINTQILLALPILKEGLAWCQCRCSLVTFEKLKILEKIWWGLFSFHECLAQGSQSK